MSKRKKTKTESSDSDSSSDVVPSFKLVRKSNESASNLKSKWTNKQRLLVFCSRGISYLGRHVMKNLLTIMPHARSEPKLDCKYNTKDTMTEIMELRRCNKLLYFEMRKKHDLYLWMSSYPEGPTMKFLVQNMHTMQELRLTGNCLKGSRPLLSFDVEFDKKLHLSLVKELFIQCFGTPYCHPKSQPFIDHVLTFKMLSDRIWFRNYQIMDESANVVEIGPRFCLQPILIQNGYFSGPILYKNPKYISPNLVRRAYRLASLNKFTNRLLQKSSRKKRIPRGVPSFKRDFVDEVFRSETSLKNVVKRVDD